MEQQELLTVEELETKQREVFEAKAKYEAAKKVSGTLYEEFKKRQAEHVDRLESLGKTSYKSDIGTFSYRMVEGVRLDPVNKSKFYDYLKERGVFEDLITVHSQTLNSFAKEEFAMQEEDGSLDPQLPGLIKLEPVARPSMRKA